MPARFSRSLLVALPIWVGQARDADEGAAGNLVGVEISAHALVVLGRQARVDVGRIYAPVDDVGPVGAHLGELAREGRSEEHTSELQSRGHLVCRLLLET